MAVTSLVQSEEIKPPEAFAAPEQVKADFLFVSARC